MTEIGSVSYACPERPGILHVIESSFIAEVIDPETLSPAASGSTGELILTNLGRWGSPLLRYRTGDLVKPETPGPCACGSCELALEGGLLGRLDDRVVIRGVNVFPSAIDKVIREFDEVVENRAEIRGTPELPVQLELRPDVAEPTDVARQVEAAIKASLTLSIPTTLVPTGELPRFEMKAKRWIRL